MIKINFKRIYILYSLQSNRNMLNLIVINIKDYAQSTFTSISICPVQYTYCILCTLDRMQIQQILVYSVHTTIIVTIIFHQKKGYCSRHKCILCPLIIIIKLPLVWSSRERRIETSIAYQLLYCLHWTKNMLKTRKNIRVTKYQKSDKFNITV